MTGDPGPDEPFAPVPPQNLEAEEHLLGAMMLSPRAIDAVVEEVDPQDFYRGSHAKIYEAAVALHVAGEPVDAITVSDELDRRGQLEEVGGKDRIREIATLAPVAGNARRHAVIVREMSLLRGLVMAGEQVTRLGWQRGAPIEELLEAAEKSVFDLARSRRRREFTSIGELLPAFVSNLEELHKSGKEVTGLPSGYHTLDVMTSGFQPGNLVIIAARPSMGKSGIATGIAVNVAVRSKLPVALFTLEMSEHEMMQRVISAEATVESQKLRTGRLDAEEWKRVMTTAARIQDAPLFIDDSGTLSIVELRSKARQVKLRHPDLACVIVDYMQLMVSGPTTQRVGELTEISRALKVLAGDLEVPVIALSQLSRNPEGRHDHRPVLSDLRESGAIEQDADLVAFLYRDEYYHPEETDQQGIAEVNLAKHRNGPTGTIKLSFVKRYVRFSDIPAGAAAGE